MRPTTHKERIALHEKIIREMFVDKNGQVCGSGYYKEAQRTFTPAQMGALHRKLKQYADDAYWKDAEPL